MAPNVVVHPKQPYFGVPLFLLFSSVVGGLVQLFGPNKEETDARAKQMALFMKQTISQAFSQTLDLGAGGFASGLNVLLQHATLFLQAAGIQVGLPVNNVTPEGVISVAQWVLVLLICYGMITIAFLLVTFLLRWLWRLLKVGVALACFGLILNDHSVGKETVAIRLVCLGCVCIILSIRPRKDWTMAARNVNPEQQVKLLENRVREMEKWRKRCVILSCCLIGLLCFVVFVVFRVYTVISNSKAL
ncbi:uncharacterized protein LOC127352852 [Dicentrarchus labrax]|uniref:uncharacterized protein LOC127352852 n=1 Tax=Dicentrarchus labrax TaxID=13489 RepID=UPI0021F4FE58|nr:uncharacterized protein LOC127352852 [Dicentrarchus labrax]